MRFSKSERTDLVISMTLAEIFLLLLFVIWFGYSQILGSPDDRARLLERAKRLEQENESLQAELRETNSQIDALKKRLEAWRIITGFDQPPSSTGWDEFKEEVCREMPKCADENVLVAAEILNGCLTMSVVENCPELRSWVTTQGYSYPTIGSAICSRDSILDFLERVREFYSESKSAGGECRFDYALTYRTKEDYFDGRELFERYFYPAKIESQEP